MTDPSLPLTDQLPNGRELEAAAQIETTRFLSPADYIFNPEKVELELKRSRSWAVAGKGADALRLLEMARAQIAALDGDQRYAAGFAAGVLAAAKVASDMGTERWHGTQMEDACDEVYAAIRAIPTPPDPVPGLEARVEKALLAEWTDFLTANPDDINSPEEYPDHALITYDQMLGMVRAALEGSGS